MQDPALGVAKLDGTNSAQQKWWEERSAGINDDFLDKVQDTGGRGPELQKVFDEHLEELDALKVKMPNADVFRTKHIKMLSGVAKQNPVHESMAFGPPLAGVPKPDDPDFLDPSLAARSAQRRRGRFMGARQPASQPDQVPPHFGDMETDMGRQPTEAIRDDDFGPMRRDRNQRSNSTADSTMATIDDMPTASFSSTAGKGRKSARQRAEAESLGGPGGGSFSSPPPTEARGAQAELSQAVGQPMEPMEPMRTTSLGDLWSACGASWAEYNRCAVPSDFPAPQTESGLVAGGTLTAYEHTRKAVSLFDVSYKFGLRLTGADREFVADQFLTCSLRTMKIGDVQYACVLDSKGLILDDAFVYITHEAVEIWTSGCHSRQLSDYVGHYVVYVRRTGADVSYAECGYAGAVALQGPLSCRAMQHALRELEASGLSIETLEAMPQNVGPDDLAAMPYMSGLRLVGRSGGEDTPARPEAVMLRAGTTGLDGFELMSTSGPFLELIARSLLQPATDVEPAGLHCMEIMRLEAGLPRVGADITPGKVTPVKASLAWLLDQAKMRSHLMFGWEGMFFQLAKGPKFRRVGLVLDGPGHAGCRILSNPHRQPIGMITSASWSPEHKARIAMAYMRPEYAKDNKHVLINVPYNLPTHKMRSKAIKHWIKAGSVRSAYRRLVAARVKSLPFVQHCHPEPERQKKSLARINAFRPDIAQEGAPTRPLTGSTLGRDTGRSAGSGGSVQ